ncbi:Kinetochore-associated protein 1 [Chionoecetes opilio]|uniref:Kinetochore-associated protein 1 n=1 Tax=Chionoecetes opilio TaxID=41210 RepID=A0A8J4Z115_CHIOP|nr:Kinetochore-associated protein 1 [Chionoecetes opilio]
MAGSPQILARHPTAIDHALYQHRPSVLLPILCPHTADTTPLRICPPHHSLIVLLTTALTTASPYPHHSLTTASLSSCPHHSLTLASPQPHCPPALTTASPQPHCPPALTTASPSLTTASLSSCPHHSLTLASPQPHHSLIVILPSPQPHAAPRLPFCWTCWRSGCQPPEDSSGGGALDETVTNFKIAVDPTQAEEENITDTTSLSRVIYLLRCCPLKEAVSYLLNRALNDNTSISAAHRLRALRCLLAIADEATIQSQYSQGVAGLRSLLKAMMYVSRMESLGHTCSAQQFTSMDKSALVEGLWRTQRHSPKALCLITEICNDYKVTAASLWGALLMQLTRFVKSGQVEVVVLERVLLQLKSVPHLWVVPALTTAWTTLITHPFTKAVTPVSEASLASCLHSVDLLLRHCPVLVATAPLLQHCAALGLPQHPVLPPSTAKTSAAAIRTLTSSSSSSPVSMVEAADGSALRTTYLKLKPQFAFPKLVEELLEPLQVVTG